MPDEEQLNRKADLAKAAAAGDDDFLAAGADHKAGEVLVYRVGGDQPAAVTFRYTDLSDQTVRVRILAAAISKKQAELLTKTIKRDDASLRAEGINLLSLGVGPDGVYEIGLREAQQHEATLLRRYAIFGPQTVRVIEKSHAVPLLIGRQDATSPLFGPGGG